MVQQYHLTYFFLAPSYYFFLAMVPQLSVICLDSFHLLRSFSVPDTLIRTLLSPQKPRGKILIAYMGPLRICKLSRLSFWLKSDRAEPAPQSYITPQPILVTDA